MSVWIPLARFRYIVPNHTIPSSQKRLQQAWLNEWSCEEEWRDVPTEVVSSDVFNNAVLKIETDPKSRTAQGET